MVAARLLVPDILAMDDAMTRNMALRLAATRKLRRSVAEAKANPIAGGRVGANGKVHVTYYQGVGDIGDFYPGALRWVEPKERLLAPEALHPYHGLNGLLAFRPAKTHADH
jgi:hypothetical protein